MDEYKEEKSFAPDAVHQENGSTGQRHGSIYDVDTSKVNVNAVFENPLAMVPQAQMLEDVEEFCRQHNLTEHLDSFRKGAMCARDPTAVATADWLTDSEREVILREKTNKWDYPWMLYFLTGTSASHLASPLAY